MLWNIQEQGRDWITEAYLSCAQLPSTHWILLIRDRSGWYIVTKNVFSKIILLGIISIVCIAGTSDTLDSGPYTTMKRHGASSRAWRGSMAALWSSAWTLEDRSLLPYAEEWREVAQSEWCWWKKKNINILNPKNTVLDFEISKVMQDLYHSKLNPSPSWFSPCA